MDIKKRLIIFGNKNNYTISNSLLKSDSFCLSGGIVDTFADIESQNIQRNFLLENNLKELTLDTLDDEKPDLGLIINYGKIIPPNYLSKFQILNLHGGLLPKWRGLNANCWALINGENHVGYTLHRIDEGLDTGPIYHKFIVAIDDDEHYAKVIPRIEQQVADNLNNIITDIIDGKLSPVSQEDVSHIYTTRLRPEIGNIINWNIKTDYLYNLYRVIGAPYGTGIFFSNKEKTYEITKMSKCKDIVDYIGIPGVVVLKKENSVIVKTEDNVISIDEIKQENNFLNPAPIFRMGQKL